ncbi:MAG: AtpZ/AtpI family protein [Phycisphaerae bacterium]|nr:AtpZ/AtpI family protein [Phycisphaerae bacterium]
MKASENRWLRHMGMGIEFAASFGAFVAIGWWIGRHFECNPWAMLIGAGLGFVGAMYNLIREGLKLQREVEAQRRAASKQHRGGSSGDRDRSGEHHENSR